MKWNIKSKRFLLACIPAVILLAVGIKTVIMWDATLFVQIAPWCLGYLTAYSGFDSWKPSQ